jgi:hypothetical protein
VELKDLTLDRAVYLNGCEMSEKEGQKGVREEAFEKMRGRKKPMSLLANLQ